MTTTFFIEKLECQSCVLVIEGLCEDIPGVVRAEVKPKDKHLILEHHDAVDLAQLKTSLEKQGYRIQQVSERK